MSVRVVARIRPLLEKELDKDIIVHADTKDAKHYNVVKIPNPKNESEEFSFSFNSVYEQETTQEDLFSAEVSPHIKSLFQGLDVTIFAYGVTGTGKTHTMRGGLKLAERGVIPRLLSNVFRRAKKTMKDNAGATTVDVALSYYEIYNDKVFDLLETPDKRTPSGLPLREKDGKTIVVGLSERECSDLKDFERLYIEANTNRVTAATKLNAHSSRSHAILRVKVTQTTGDQVRESTASAIDLAGSEDNRRTDNGKERLVESAAINKSLFVLSQCIDAISRGDKRIPYRESKMTRILSLGQNNGITIMILNLAPLRSYHLDTLSSLNVSSRAKRIEVREIENEIVYKQPPRNNGLAIGGATMQRQPLRALSNAHNVATGAALAAKTAGADKPAGPEKPVKAFSVYTDRGVKAGAARTTGVIPSSNNSKPRKRPSDSADASLAARPPKMARPTHSSLARPLQHAQPHQPSISAAQIEAMVERKVSEILAMRAAAEVPAVHHEPIPTTLEPTMQQTTQISEEVQRRLDALERRIEDRRTQNSGGAAGETRSEGLRYLLRAKQAKERGDDAGTLQFYELARPYFPSEAKLAKKIERLRVKLAGDGHVAHPEQTALPKKRSQHVPANDYQDQDSDYRDAGDADVDEESLLAQAAGKQRRQKRAPKRVALVWPDADGPASPRAQQLLDIVNSRNLVLIKGLHGFGAKKAQDLVDQLGSMGEHERFTGRLESLAQLRTIPGMGVKTVERAYEGLIDVGFF